MSNICLAWIVVLASAGVAVGQLMKGFSVTNSDGRVYDNCRLVRVESGQAIVISGTSGVRVPVDRLPAGLIIDPVMANLGEASRRSPGQLFRTDKTDTAVFVGVPPDGLSKSAVILSLVRFKQDAPHYGAFLKVWTQRPFTMKTPGYAQFKGNDASDSVAATTILPVTTNPIHTNVAQSFSWETDLAVRFTLTDLVRICIWTNLAIRIQGDSESYNFLIGFTALRSDFRTLCAADAMAPAQARITRNPTAGIGAGKPDPIGPSPVGSVQIRLVDSAFGHDTWSWKTTVVNGAEPGPKYLTIQFLDASGFVVAEDFQALSLKAFEVLPLTGSRFVRKQVGDEIKSAKGMLR